MKHFSVLFLCVLLAHFSSNAQNKSKPANTIRPYWFVMLTKGANRSQDNATAMRLQEGHMANIRRLYNAGKLKVAGPFGDDGNWRGIFIFDQSADSCATKEQLEKLLQTDPAIAAGRLAFEIHPWYTSPTGSFVPGMPPAEEIETEKK